MIGRQHDLETLRTLLSRPGRLVNLVGPPGIGKTRLARSLHESADGELGPSHFCDLTQVRDLREALAEIARELGLTLAESEDTDLDHINLIGHALRTRKTVLLILDNVEQIADDIGSALSAWLRQDGHAAFLTTSRRILRLREERVYELAPLTLPATDDDWQCEAMALFLERASAIEPTFRASTQTGRHVAALVRRLEGLPLAIELAASQMGRTGPKELLGRLRNTTKDLNSAFRDPDPRHQSLHDAIQGSWNLLDAGQQRALSLLTLFRGPFTEEAATALLTENSAGGATSVLGPLREASLLRVTPELDPAGERRWDMFVAVREFSATRLVPEQHSEAKKRYAYYWLDWGERWTASLPTEQGLIARQLLMSSLRELQTAFQIFSDELADSDAASRLALVMFEAVREWMPSEALPLLNRALTLDESQHRRTVSMASLLTARGVIHRDLDRYRSAAQDFVRARSHASASSPEGALIDYEEGVALFARGACTSARRLLERGLTTARACGLLHLQGRFHFFLARVLAEAFLDPRAFEHHSQAAEAFRQTGSVCDQDSDLLMRASHCFFFQDGESVEQVKATILPLQASGNRLHHAMASNFLGLVLHETGLWQEAEAAFYTSIDVADSAGLRRPQAAGHLRLAMAQHERGMPEARANYERAVALFCHSGDVRNELLSKLLLSGCLAMSDEVDQATETLQEAENLLPESEVTGFEYLVDLQRSLLALISARHVPDHERASVAAEAIRQANDAISISNARREHKPAPAAASAEIRFVVRLLHAELTSLSQIEIWSDGSRFRRHGGMAVELPQGPVLRRLLCLLAERQLDAPGSTIATDSIVSTCWPGQRLIPEAAQKRVQESIRRLRRLGLDSVLQTVDGGYSLDAKARVSIVQDEAGSSRLSIPRTGEN